MNLLQHIEKAAEQRDWIGTIERVKERILEAEHTGKHAIGQALRDLGDELLGENDAGAPS